MNLELWTAVDRYISDMLIPPDPILDAALQASADAGLPPINVAPNQGKFLQMLAKIQGAKRILEIGTLGGYSTIWLARALPADGQLITLEFEPKHAAVARKNFARAGLANVIELRPGPAIGSLRQLVTEKQKPFDFIFIDADKEGYPDYFTWSLKLSRRGTCIVADNVVRQGGVIDPAHKDPRVQGVRCFNELLAAEPRVTATTLQTVGGKGYDGFTLAIVTADF
jgi:predicted O-methyltransferase YrrM